MIVHGMITDFDKKTTNFARNEKLSINMIGYCQVSVFITYKIKKRG